MPSPNSAIGTRRRPQSDEVRQSCATLLTALQQERDRLTKEITRHLQHELADEYRLAISIPGIGRVTAAALLGEYGNCSQFTHGRQLGAMAGLSVRQHDSGTSVHGKPRITKQGSAAVRRALYWPAVAAIRCDPTLHAFAERLAAKGKAGLQIICAVMRKLLERFFAVLHTRTPYDPAYQSPLAHRRVEASPGTMGGG
jgi:transposase